MYALLVLTFFALLFLLYRKLSSTDRAFAALQRGKVPVGRRNGPIDDGDTRVAVHEAGHVLVAARCTRVVAVKSAEITSEGGSVAYDIGGADGKPEAEMVIRLAGLAAENMIFGVFRASECRSDLLHAKALSKNSDVGRFPYAPETCASFIAEVFTDGVDESERRALAFAYATARALLAKDVLAHAKLTGALLAMRKMNERDIERHVGGRGFIRALSSTRRLFI